MESNIIYYLPSTTCQEMNSSKEQNPAEFLKMQPKKSILKAKQSSLEELRLRQSVSVEREQREESEESQKEAHFDEMNILATFHPPDKDYGHMKIDEPKTPYTGCSDSEEDSSMGGTRHRRVSLIGPICPDELKKGISEATSSRPKCFEPGSGPEDDEDETLLTTEQIQHKRDFEKKRRAHYDEGMMMRRMREKAKSDENEDEDD